MRLDGLNYVYVIVKCVLCSCIITSCGFSPLYMGGQVVTHDQSCTYEYIDCSLSIKDILHITNEIAIKNDYRQMSIAEYYAGTTYSIEHAKTSPYRRLGENREYNIVRREEIFNQWKSLCETRNGIILIKNRHISDQFAGDTSSFSIQVCYSDGRLSSAVWTSGGYGSGSLEAATKILNEFKQDLLAGIAKYSPTPLPDSVLPKE